LKERLSRRLFRKGETGKKAPVSSWLIGICTTATGTPNGQITTFAFDFITPDNCAFSIGRPKPNVDFAFREFAVGAHNSGNRQMSESQCSEQRIIH
jgi:hypothetical protein